MIKIITVFLFAVLLMQSCISVQPVVNFTDYSHYGIFITESNSVNFNYTPVGSVQVVLSVVGRNDEPMQSQPDRKDDDVYFTDPKLNNATLDNALSMLVQQSKERGANAIINLRYEYLPSNRTASPGWFVSGMAIKK